MGDLFGEIWKQSAPYPMKYQRMEQLFASTYYEVLHSKGSSHSGQVRRRLMDELIWTLRDTLLLTTNLAVPEQHIRLLSLLSKNSNKVSIVSFNYDVLCDRALRIGNDRKFWNWSHKDGYGFRPNNHPTPKTKSGIMLYKMHGSMNWYVSKPSWNRSAAYDPKAAIYLPKPASNRQAAAWQRRQFTLGRSRMKIYPLLVPPVYEKGQRIHDDISKMWTEAKRELQNATLVIVWGYSLPVTDYHSEILFAGAARQAHNRLMVINPSKDALSRVTCVAGHRWNRWFFKVEHFLAAMKQIY